MAFTPMHEITIKYGMTEDGEPGVYWDTDGDVPYVIGLGMLEAVKADMSAMQTCAEWEDDYEE